jgi:hypothetical protein
MRAALVSKKLKAEEEANGWKVKKILFMEFSLSRG